MKREYAYELTNTAVDYEMDFDPRYLETQLAIVNDIHERDHIEQVIIQQLIRETTLCNTYADDAAKYKQKLINVTQTACQELIGQLPFPIDQY